MRGISPSPSSVNTFNDISSKATRPVGPGSLGLGIESLCFYVNWFFILVAMALINGKSEKWHLLPGHFSYFDKTHIKGFLILFYQSLDGRSAPRTAAMDTFR